MDSVKVDHIPLQNIQAATEMFLWQIQQVEEMEELLKDMSIRFSDRTERPSNGRNLIAKQSGVPNILATSLLLSMATNLYFPYYSNFDTDHFSPAWRILKANRYIIPCLNLST